MLCLDDRFWRQSLALLTITACTPSHEVARQGRHLVIGMEATALQACAGIPTRTAQLDPRTQLWSYENKYERTGGLEITLPIIGGGLAAGGSGSYCHALVRIVDGRVAGVTSCRRQRRLYRAGWRVRPDLPRLPARAGEIARRALRPGGPASGHAARSWRVTFERALARTRLAFTQTAGMCPRRRPVRDRGTPQPEAYEGPSQQGPRATERLRDRPGNVAAGAPVA